MDQAYDMILRALTTSNFGTLIHEDLSDLITLLTPTDTPLYSGLQRGRATALTHEWPETTLTSTFTTAAYADGGTPTEHTNTHARRSSKVMSLGRIAKASELLNATNTVGKSMNMDAYALEFKEKMIDLMRAIEYYCWNGDSANTSPQEMSGIVTLGSSFTQTSNGGSAAALVQTNLDTAIVAAYNAGGTPDTIYCRPIVAQRIANFNANKILMPAGGGINGLTAQNLFYHSPLGAVMKVVPVRPDFMPSGAVYIIDSSKVRLCPLGEGTELKVKELPLDGDVVAKTLIKFYGTLEVRALAFHGRVTNVLDSL